MSAGLPAERRRTMDKYGVETDEKDPKVKEARDKSVCPICGARLESHANVPKCPKHGVKPFEKGDDPEDTVPEL